MRRRFSDLIQVERCGHKLEMWGQAPLGTEEAGWRGHASPDPKGGCPLPLQNAGPSGVRVRHSVPAADTARHESLVNCTAGRASG